MSISISLSDFTLIVLHIKQNGADKLNKMCADLLLKINKLLFEFAALMESKNQGAVIIKVMEKYDLKIENYKENSKENYNCCICEKGNKTIRVVFPIENGLQYGFYVCSEGSCINLILTIYNLAHFEKRCMYNENIHVFYKEFLKEVDELTKNINKLKQ